MTTPIPELEAHLNSARGYVEDMLSSETPPISTFPAYAKLVDALILALKEQAKEARGTLIGYVVIRDGCDMNLDGTGIYAPELDPKDLLCYGTPYEVRSLRSASPAKGDVKGIVEPRPSCPCTVAGVTPCHPRCTCTMPVSSSGCACCAQYGSLLQRQHAARRIIAEITKRVTYPVEGASNTIAIGPDQSGFQTLPPAAKGDVGGILDQMEMFTKEDWARWTKIVAYKNPHP